MTRRSMAQAIAILVLVLTVVITGVWQKNHAKRAAATAPAAPTTAVTGQAAATSAAAAGATSPGIPSAPGAPVSLPGASIPTDRRGTAAPEVDATVAAGGVVRVKVLGAVDTETAQAVTNAAAAFLAAYWGVDSTRPYPGKDVDWISAQILDGSALAPDMASQVESWRSPRDADKRAYDQAASRHYRATVTVTQAWVREAPGGAVVTLAADLATVEDGARNVVESRVAQMDVAQQDGWKIARFTDSPASP